MRLYSVLAAVYNLVFGIVLVGVLSTGAGVGVRIDVLLISLIATNAALLWMAAPAMLGRRQDPWVDTLIAVTIVTVPVMVLFFIGLRHG